ncbi:hypothetical protein ACFWBB_29815 [Streptomyces sp. NPDC060000]|uniref:hypothetical protein n=1 Tax=Streptomyces sp. NPDC060000 TaxID=3347031 RepID=UPI00368E4DD7
MDWVSPLSGIVGVVVGGAITLRGSKAALDRQLADAKAARTDAERIAVSNGLSNALTKLVGKADDRQAAVNDAAAEACLAPVAARGALFVCVVTA